MSSRVNEAGRPEAVAKTSDGEEQALSANGMSVKKTLSGTLAVVWISRTDQKTQNSTDAAKRSTK